MADLDHLKTHIKLSEKSIITTMGIQMHIFSSREVICLEN